MLSLLRWGLGSGSDPLTEKEKLKVAAEKPSPRGKMAGAQSKRKRTNTATHGSPAKQAKRQAGAVPKSARIEQDTDDVPPLQNFANQISASVNGVQYSEPQFSATAQNNNIAAIASNASLPEQTSVEQWTPSLPAVPRVADMNRVQQMIEEQFSLEILLKHRELRLIDQEIAKCQVALEQLRRCQVIPYPSQTGKPQDMLNVSGGIGQPMRTRHSRQPSQPTPWGVIEGPYSRHYSQWLMPDPTFDGGVVEDYPTAVKGVQPADRQTRGGKPDAKPRTHRGVVESRLQALPSGYPPAAKEDKGLAILKRHSDGKMVKLYCSICDRYDFSSAQGFINHYRIAHDKNLKSHEQAAQVCGVELGANETVATPGLSTAGMQTPAGALVHAYNRPTAFVTLAANVPMLSTPVPRKKRGTRVDTMTQALAGPTKPDTQFKPSHETPHLSKAFASAGKSGDFAALVSEMKEKLVEPPVPEEEENNESGPEQDESTTPLVATHMARVPSGSATRRGVRGAYLNMSGMRPQSRKGPERQGRREGTRPDPTNAISLPITLELPEKPHDLSPHTVESNNAPSLTSDSDDEYRNGGSSTAPSSHGSEADNDEHMDVDVEVEELGREREEEHEARRAASIQTKTDVPEIHATRKAKVKAPRRAAAPAPAPAPPPPPPAPAKAEAPRKRGRPRKVQPK